MTLDEKIALVHGEGMPGWGKPRPNAYLGNGGAGFVLGVPRLGIPMIQISDAAYGVRSSAQNGRYSTALPSNITVAASWDPQAACEYGMLIGRELRTQGYNMTLGGGVNVTREPRNGRTFEYQGEDPVLAGTLVGNRIKCEQAHYVIGDIKHYAVNDQESGRNEVNAIVGERALRETPAGLPDRHQHWTPGSDNVLLQRPQWRLRLSEQAPADGYSQKGLGVPGLCGLRLGRNPQHREGLRGWPRQRRAGGHLFRRQAEGSRAGGQVPMSELDEHVHRVLRSEFATGLVDHPTQKSVADVEGGLEISRRIAEQSTVLLKNADNILPLDPAKLHSIAVIGPHADAGMISGGGSAQVDPPGRPPSKWLEQVWFPTSPLKAVTAKAAGASVQFDSGADPVSAAALARNADVALVFVYQWQSEDMDLPDLSLPEKQDVPSTTWRQRTPTPSWCSKRAPLSRCPGSTRWVVWSKRGTPEARARTP
jgi:beta-glucosidase